MSVQGNDRRTRERERGAENKGGRRTRERERERGGGGGERGSGSLVRARSERHHLLANGGTNRHFHRVLGNDLETEEKKIKQEEEEDNCTK